MLKFVIIVVAVALVVWAIVRILELRRGGSASGQLPRRQPPPRVTGPDDDPDFLRDLERRQRRRQEEEPGDPGA